MLSVTLGPINNIQVPGSKTVLVPLTGVDSGGGPINYTFSSSDTNVHLSLVSPTSKSIQLNVIGTDSSNNPFTGTLVLHLFEDLAPQTTARIEQLVSQGYYNGLDFFRVVDGFVAQTGRSNNGNDTGVTLDDEINAGLTFTSPGLLAMANRGISDTADAEFFITAIDGAGTTNPTTLAQMPQGLNLRFTIFGQLVSGFDTFEKIMSTTVTTSSVLTGETSMPVNSITVTSATIINDTHDAVLAVTAPASFNGNSATITVTATNSANETAQQMFTAAAVTDTHVDPPFLGAVPSHSAAIGSTSNLTLQSTDLSGGGVSYIVVDSQTLGQPTKVTQQLNQQSGMVSFTGKAGFTGNVNLLAGVRATSAPANMLESYDTQKFTLTLVAPTLSPVSNQTTAIGAADKFTLSSVDTLGNNVAYSVVDAATLAAPTNLDVSINQSTGEVTLTPHAGFTGTVNLLARVIDVTSANDPANFVTQPFTLTVVAPTLDPVTNQTTAVGVGKSFKLNSGDSLGNSVSYSVVDATTLAAPANIDVSIDSSGNVTLTPHAGFSGPVNLRARVIDSTSANDPANYTTQPFSLTVIAPTLGSVSNQQTIAGLPGSFTLTSNVAIGHNVLYSVVDAATLAAPANVDVTITQATGQVTLTPHAGFHGTVNLLARVIDTTTPNDPANFTTQPFMLTVVALNPVDNKATVPSSSITITLTTTPSASGLAYRIVDASTFAAPAHLTIQSINNSTGEVVLKPESGFTGTIQLRAGVRLAGSADTEANYNFDPFNLDVTAPTLSPVTDQTTAEGAPLSLTLNATNPAGGGLVYKIVDPTTHQPPLHVTVGTISSSGQVTLTPEAGFTGSVSLLAEVRAAGSDDVQSNYATQAFTLNVAKPSLSQVNDQSTTVGVTVPTFNLSASDPIGEGLFFDVVDPTTLAAPSHVTVAINHENGQVTLSPQAGFGGVVHLLARVRSVDSPDEAQNYSTQEFTLTINSTVTLDQLNNIQVPGGKSVLVPLTGVDSGGQPITYTFNSSNPAVQLSLVSSASKSIKLDVTGTDKNNQPFSGTLILHLFEDLAPETTARIEQLVSQGYYNNLLFHRVLDGFVAQTGQTNGGLDTGVKLDDEFDASLTYVSPGLLGLARQTAHDTGDAEFFITAVDGAGTTAPITLANDPQFLTFRYTIFGQLVSGFDTFEKIMTAQVQDNGANETSSPVDSITVTSATLIEDTQDAVLRVFAPASFNGNSATITVTATNQTGQSTQKTFGASAVTNTTVDPPFLGPVSNQTTTSPTPANFTLTSTDTSGGGVTYKITTPSFGTPSNVTVNINQATGQVSLTPAAGFSGTINLLAAVRATNAADSQANYDTQAFTLTVNPSSSTTPTAPTGLAIDATSNTGPFDGNGYISTGTPKLNVTAETGAAVQFKLNGAVIATATESTTNPGHYSATIPAGKLAVGTNSITAVVMDANGTSADSTALSLIYAPDYGAGVYVVPGTAGSTQHVLLAWAARNAAYADEFGYFVASSIDGSVGGKTPGSAGYAQAALSSSTRHVIFAKGQKAGADADLALTGGQMIVFYMIQNNTTASFLSKNPSNSIHGNNNADDPLAFFSIKAANPDHMKHAQIIADRTTGRTEINWEDLLTLGDSDFNDAVITVRLAGQSGDPPSTIHAPGTGDKNDTVNGTLGGGNQSHAPGDIGIYFVDNPDGSIGSLHPGDAGYAAAALGTGNFRVLFASGAAAGTLQHVNVPAGKYVAFYVISNGTTANFLTANPTNASDKDAVAMFSFDSANANDINHFRWYTPGQEATNPDVMRLHIMDKVFGNASDFDDLTVDLSFAPSSSSSG
jgi:cyclophilin family peptidyl-prolyl cis-trans isomerase